MTRARVFVLVAWLVLVAGTAFAAGPLDRKADPALRVAVSEWAEAQRLGTSAAGEAARRALLDGAGYYRLRREPGLDEPLVPTFVRLSDPAAQRALEAQGARIQVRVGDIVVAHLPISRVAAIAALPDVAAMEMSGTAAPFLNASRAASHVDEVHAGTGLDRAYQGAGVVVGVFDSGLDYTHPDFKTAGGATRLRGLFDYSSGIAGREWSIGSIDSATSTEYDGHLSGGHGTHVTGTAAGGGRLNAAYRGVAPLADIVFVKGMRDTASGSGFNTADIVAGVQYIFNKARTLGEPCVVNLSLGGQDGPHDGTSLYEQAFDGLTHPGNIIVVSAGNSNGDYVHGGYDVPSGTTYPESNETAWFIYPGTSQAIVDAWYPSSGNIRFGVAVYAIGSYGTPLALTNPIGPGTAANNVTVTDGATNYGRVTIDATTSSDPNNGKRRVLFILSNSSSFPGISNYVWSIYAVGNGAFDMWTVTGGAFPPAAYFGGLPPYFVAGDNDKSIATPATARKVISVGSYVTKTQWVDVNGVTRNQPNATLNQISTFSSVGPSADGRTLPTLAAPGEAIVAPLAYTAAGFTPSTDIVQGGGYLKLQGTSMAAPHVTGSVALLLERNRYLTPENVRDLLQASAAAPGAGGPFLWGAGKLHTQAAMQATPFAQDCGTPRPFGARPVDCPDDIAVAAGVLLAHPNPSAGEVGLQFRLASPERVDLAIYDLAGRRIRVVQSGLMAGGPHDLTWDGTDDQGVRVRGGVYFARLWTPSRTARERVVVVR